MGEVVDLDAYREKRIEQDFRSMPDVELVAEYKRLETVKEEHLNVVLEASYKQAVIEREAASRGVSSLSRRQERQ